VSTLSNFILNVKMFEVTFFQIRRGGMWRFGPNLCVYMYFIETVSEAASNPSHAALFTSCLRDVYVYFCHKRRDSLLS